jgi:inosine-uridine nucleoside N-ribohydrolase/formylmethanofuran dehydrogenase subunit E
MKKNIAPDKIPGQNLFSSILSIFLMIFLNIGLYQTAFPHSGKPTHHVIIDTDGAPDDFRALNMLLATPEIEVLAITTTDGVLTAKETYVKVKALLRELHHEGIPVAYGKALNRPLLPCHQTCLNANWGDESDIEIPGFPDAVGLITHTLEEENDPVTLVCLGPLTNIAALPDLDNQVKIGVIVWYCDGFPNDPGMNETTNPNAAQAVLHSMLPVIILDTPDHPGFAFDELLWETLSDQSPYSQCAKRMFAQSDIHEIMAQGIYRLWDDMAPLYLLHEEWFETQTEMDGIPVMMPSRTYLDSLRRAIPIILDQTSSIENTMFYPFPTTPESYFSDVPEANSMIKNYGPAEWRAVVLTNELHGHLGIYSVIGAKMGIRAREYFGNIGLDELHIEAFTGDRPPLSCLIDGLQASTGSTMGHGMIRIADTGTLRPAATCSFNNRSITISLRPEYSKIIRADIQNGIREYGNLTPEYWKFIRELAIEYWVNWSRHDIFIIEAR